MKGDMDTDWNTDSGSLLGWTGVTLQIWTPPSPARSLSDCVSIFLMMASHCSACHVVPCHALSQSTRQKMEYICVTVSCNTWAGAECKHVCGNLDHVMLANSNVISTHGERQFYFNKSPSIAQFYCSKRQTLLQLWETASPRIPIGHWKLIRYSDWLMETQQGRKRANNCPDWPSQQFHGGIKFWVELNIFIQNPQY